MAAGESRYWFGAPLSRPTTVAALRAVHADAASRRDDSGADGLPITEIARRADVSRPMAEEALTELRERDLVVEIMPDPDAPRTVGRPAKRYRFNSEFGYVLGVDIGIHKVLALCTDLSGTLRGSHRVEVSADLDNSSRIDAARVALKRAARAGHARLSDVLAVGVGTTGPVDPRTGEVVQSPALLQWSGVDLRQELSGIGTGSVVAGNDANLGALAEAWRGVAGGSSDVVYVLAGHQISVGILINGQLRHGRHGAAGEIGQLRAAGWYDARDALRERKPVDAPDFVDALATGIAATVLTVDPDMVVIGGGLSQAGEKLLIPLRRRLDELCMFSIPVQASQLGERNVALGAVRLALDDLESALFELS
ncbi:ROK family protein [Streptomyces sp. NPDC051976]|uniref:ROK family protein n=1 Tax=Streptomyces sp. NPDC051976 TaxID=3154947 RepID=UPI0034225226